jgi:crotonobetainyl-CoA:carnitine CoA-transferase CaiB-like acyl-CoA transferase
MRHPGGEPAGWGFSYSDMAAGNTTALAALIALWHRRRSGQGQFVDVSQLEAAVALIGPSFLDILVNAAVPQPIGNRSPERLAAPHGVYRCRDLPGDAPAADRWCAICVFTEDEWSRFVEVLGRPAWTNEGRFATLEARLANQDDLDALVEQWTRERTAEEVMDNLQVAGVAAGLVANARDLCQRDPHLRRRGYWVAVETPEGDCVTLDGVPIRLSNTPGCVAAPGPLLGEHTTQVLRDVLRIDEAEIERLKREKVVM